MSFLAPIFLVGLAALAIPVFVHLIQRERKNIVEFPSLMFLRKIPYQSVQRRRIHNWLLLMMRLAALVLLMAAFARPFLNRQDIAAAATSGARELVILLDHSYSMGYGDRWARAQAAARQAVEGLGADDRGTLIEFSTSAALDVRSSIDRGPLLTAIDAAQLGAGATRYGPALKLAQSVLTESELPRKEVVLVSDFQRIGWDRAEDVRFPDGTVLTPVSVADATTSNVAVSAVTFQRGTVSGQERVTVSAALTNRSESAVQNLDVTLEMDGRQLQTVQVSVEANGSGQATFAPFTLTGAHTRGSVRTAADALVTDNSFNFVLSPSESLPVLIVQRESAGREASLYVSRALAIGSAPAFRVEVKPIERVGPADLDNCAVLVMNDVPLTSGALVSRVRRYVEEGGGLLVVLGERGAWPDGSLELLPGTPGAPVDRPGRGGTLSVTDYAHPIFELFRSPRSGDFSAARFFRYRALAAPQPPSTSGGATAPIETAHVLARFDDGTTAFAERRVGKGRVLLWTSTLDTFWNDLALKPVFLPLVHRVARYLADYTEAPLWYTVGDVVDVASLRPEGSRTRFEANPARKADTPIALNPSGERVQLDGEDESGLLELTDQGFYTVRTQAAEEKRPITVAVNTDPTESDLSPLDPQELLAAVTGHAASTAANRADQTLSPREQERRQSGWWYLLLAAALLLVSETWVANRYARALGE